MLQQKISRRQALKLFGMGAAGAALAACAPVGAPAAQAPAQAGGTPAPSGEKIKISISHIGGNSAEASEKSQRMMMLRKNFPDIEFDNLWVSYAAYLDKIPLNIASNDLADMQFCNAFNDVPLMMQNELLTAMDDYLAQYGKDITAVTPEKAWDSTIYDGKQYALAHNIYDLNIWGAYHRQDWLDKLGLKGPTTIDEYEKVLDGYTKNDPDGNGKADTYGRTLDNTIRFDDDLFHPFGVAVGHHMNGFWRKRGDALAIDWVQPQMKDALAWLRKLWAEGVFDPDSITLPLGQEWNSLKGGIVGNAYTAWTSMDDAVTQIQNVQKGGSLVATNAMSGPAGEGGFTGEGWPWVYVVPKTAKNPDKVTQVLDWFYTPDVVAQVFCEGVAGVTNPGPNDKGWCQEYTPQEKAAMSDWADKQNSVADIVQYQGLWLPYSTIGQTPVFSTMPADMQKHFTDIMAAKYSKAALDARDISQKYLRLTEKKRPVDAEKDSWPGLQTRFAEFISQAVSGTIDLDSGWNDWLAYFQANGGPAITDQVNKI